MSRTQYGQSGFSSGNESDGQGSPRERGARRKKLAGYLKAANELRQSYQDSYSARWAGRERDAYGTDGESIPGSFPDVSIVSNGAEEMMLFPSYARRHVKTQRNVQDEMSQEESGMSDEQYWKRQFELSEDDRAVIDVDVRGWIYTPQRGPLTRKNRIMVGLARQLSGIPAPTNEHYAQVDTHDKIHTTHEERAEARRARAEAEEVAAEAEKLMSVGERERRKAERGAYSEDPRLSAKHPSHSGHSSIGSSPDRMSGRLTPRRTDSSRDDSPIAAARRSGWSPFAASNPAPPMSPTELIAANNQMMSRLRPFMTTPSANLPITIFYFNNETSQSRTVRTDEYGHFNLRTALEFMPTEIRVLASDKLSVKEDVRLIPPRGISMISDVDDTIKHSAISAGAREIFRNVFVRDLAELQVEGVREWYTALYDMGVRMHYVSNAPWQTYPLLKSYFELAGLPPGSFHLKKYTGMLQGIFEPVAERKKSTLERLMSDFPERKFILVGDSGEADLEVYTEMMEQYPGRILGVFIRDVTTVGEKIKGLIEGTGEAVREKLASEDEPRPSLPPRPSQTTIKAEAEEDLIDFGDSPVSNTKPGGVPKPPKPSNLRKSIQSSDLPAPKPKPGYLSSTPSEDHFEVPKTKPPPPTIPAKPRSLSREQVQTLASKVPLPPTPSPRTPKPGYLNGSAGNTQSSTSMSRESGAPSLPVRRDLSEPSENGSAAPPPPPSRRGGGITGLPAAAANKLWYGTSTTSQLTDKPTGTSSANPPSLSATSSAQPPPDSADEAARSRWALSHPYPSSDQSVDGELGAQISKKEELWQRRWVRAEQVARREGVVLVSWRVGGDVIERCKELVRKGLVEMGEEAKRDGK